MEAQVTAQLSLIATAPAPAKPVRPTLEEIRDAIRGSWLEVRLHVSPARFRATIVGHEKDCATHTWRNLERIWSAYAKSDREFVEHLRAHPEVYGKATPEMIERFTALAAEHSAAARRWAGLRAWVETNPLPDGVSGWDPTAGCTIHPEEMASIPDDVAESDPLIRIALGNAASADQHVSLLPRPKGLAKCGGIP